MKYSEAQIRALKKLMGGCGWMCQHHIGTSRGTLNILTARGLLERTKNENAVGHLPELGAMFRIKRTSLDRVAHLIQEYDNDQSANTKD